jgi:hypothetical protein
MTLFAQAASRETLLRGSFWRRPEPKRIIRLIWPAAGAWGLVAISFVVFHLKVGGGSLAEEGLAFRVFVEMLLWTPILGWVSAGYVVVALISRAPTKMRLVAAAVNVTPLAACAVGMLVPDSPFNISGSMAFYPVLIWKTAVLERLLTAWGAVLAVVFVVVLWQKVFAAGAARSSGAEGSRS